MMVMLIAIEGAEIANKAKEALSGMHDYTAQAESKTYGKDEKLDYRVYSQKWMRPGYIYMKVIRGVNEGGVAVYYPDKKKVRAKKGFLRLWLSPDDRRLRSPVGHRIYESTIPWFIERLNGEAKFLSEGELFGRKVYILEQPLSPTKNYGAVKAKYWIDAQNFLPLMIVDYDSKGNKIRTMKFTNIKLNVGLKKDDFEI